MKIGGIDVGTTGCKITVFGADGREWDTYYREYPPRSDPHVTEAEPIFRAVTDVLREAVKAHPDLSAVGVTTFGEAFVLIGEDEKPLAPILLFTDTRSAGETDELCRSVGTERISRITGVRPDPMYSLPKLMWMKKHLPAFEKTKYVFLMQDYIVWRLTGARMIDWSAAARTMAFDVKNKCFSETMLSAAGIGADLFSIPATPGTPAGTIRGDVAAQTGADPGLIVVCGVHDQAAAALGAGVFTSSSAVDGTGTVECVSVLLDRLPEDPAFYENGFCAVPYVLPDTYLCYAYTLTGGACAKWVRDKLTPDLIRDHPGENVYRILDQTMPDHPTGLLVLPHFAGSALPRTDAGSRAAIVGLDLSTTREDLYRAVLEGVTMEMRLLLEKLEGFGVCPRTLTAVGGGASAPAWLQIKADVFGKKIRTLKNREAGAAGTAMLTARALGLYPDLFSAAAAFLRPRHTYEPGEQRQTYESIFESYRGLYDAVRPLIKERIL